MWPTGEGMQTFQALSYSDKWRVRGFLVRGEAPPDRQTAAAAAELAESYQRQGRTFMKLMRWLSATGVVVFGAAAIFMAIDGDALKAILYALLALTNVAHLMYNPAVRPQNVARSLEASRQVIASDG